MIERPRDGVRTPARSHARGLWFVAAVTASGLWAGCAQQEMPPGGPDDRRPPVVVETFPQPLGDLSDLGAAVRFTFDERISERVTSGDLTSAISVSPRTGQLRVEKGSRSLEVRPRGGFQPGQVYRVTLQAVVSDLFGNRMTDPFELVFTTGAADPVPTTLAGEVWDRTSGRAVGEATVVAVADDGVIHQAIADSRGIYALRYLPEGGFRIIAFEDRDRDGEADSTEVQGRTTVDLARGDTLLVDVSVLEPDTTSARVTSADAVGPSTVSVTFDDFLDPDADVSTFDVELSLADSTATGPVPGVERVYQEAAYAAFVEEVSDSLARLDSIAAEAEGERRAEAARAQADSAADTLQGTDTLRGADTVAAGDTVGFPADSAIQARPADTVRIETPTAGGGQDADAEPPPSLEPLEGVQAGPTRDGRRTLPGRRVVLLLSDTLAFDVTYRVQVSGVPNIAGLEGGEGSADFVRETPPPPDSVAADSAAVTDTASVPDTGSVARPPSGP